MNPFQKFILNIKNGLNAAPTTIGLQNFYQYINNNSISFNYDNMDANINEAYGRTTDVYSIVSYIARTASSLEWHVDEFFPDGSHQRIENSVANKILLSPNNRQSWGEFLEEHFIYRLLTGDNYIHGIKPEGFDYFAELKNLQSQFVEIVTPTGKINSLDVLGYKYQKDYDIRFSKEDVLHTFYPNPCTTTPSVYGLSPLEATLKVWKTSSERWNASAHVLKNRGVSGILTDNSDRPMSPEQAKMMQEQANTRLGGSNKYGQVMVSNKKLDFIKMGLSPQDMELLDLGVLSLRAMCNAYHVDSSLFNDPANKTYNNRKEAQKAFWTDAVLPEVYKTLNNLNQWLMPQISKYENRNLKLVVDTYKIEPLQQDEELKTDRLTKLRKEGIISGNEAREMLGFNPVDDEEMNKVYISQSQVDITENVNEN